MSVSLRRALRPAVSAILAGTALVALVAAVAASDNAGGAAGAPRPTLSVSVVQPKAVELPLQLAANGNVAAWQEAVIGAQVGGLRLDSVRVQVGQRVRRGELLASLATDTVLAERAQARAALAEVEAALGEARANAERARAVQASGALSAQQIAQWLTGEQTAAARVELARAQLQAVELRLAQTQVTAPDDGTISARSATLGAVVQPGQELFRLIRQDRLEWQAEVTAAEIARVRPGQVVSVTAATGARTTGRVRLVAPTVNPQSRQALVFVDLPAAAAAGGGFKAGMFARGEFNLGASQALTVPQTALSLRDGFSYVFTLGEGNRVRQVKVVTGRRQGDAVEVSGLQATDRVVASGGAFLTHGDTVRVVSP